jgi:hypothetical protein
MSKQFVEIKLDGRNGYVKVDGQEVHVTSVTLEGDATDGTTIFLALRPIHFEVEGDMTIVISDRVADTLKVLGWTPPPDDVIEVDILPDPVVPTNS